MYRTTTVHVGVRNSTNATEKCREQTRHLTPLPHGKNPGESFGEETRKTSE